MTHQLTLWLAWLREQGLKTVADQLRRTAPQVVQKLLIQKRYRVNVGHPTHLTILLVGAGGTGSWAAHVLAQFAAWAQDKNITVQLYYIDPDQVEEKNLVRQNFCQAEVGYPKAFTLAWRYTAAFGVRITPVVGKFKAEMLLDYRPRLVSGDHALTLIVGAVDNTPARQDIAQALEKLTSDAWSQGRYWWIDAGNERDTGQVLIGNSLEAEPVLSPLGYCTHLPLPHLQEPSLLARSSAPASDLSCADLGLLDAQSAVINRQMAAWIGVYLYRLLQSRDLDLMATWLDLHSGQVKSVPITSGRIAVPPVTSRLVRTAPQRPAELTRLDMPDNAADLNALECPQCGETGRMVDGVTNIGGAEIVVRFCEHCTYREEGCPDCWGDLEEATRLDETGDPVPVLRCTECGWLHDIRN